MKQQPLLGFLFSLLAITMWGLLPLALQPIFKIMDPQTIVWFRFASALVGTFCILFFSKKLPNLKGFSRKEFFLVLLGVFGLSCNFFLFNVALRYIPATASQVISPLSSFVMLFVGVLLFKEQMGIHQKIGLGVVIVGLLLFFSNRYASFVAMDDFAFGILCGAAASSVWIGYGIAQKLLLKRFNSLQILLMIYLGCTTVFSPVANLSQIYALDTFTAGCLIFCCLNTIIAYSGYAEALNRWEVSKVSVMMTQIPILTIIFSEILYSVFPAYFAEPDLPLLSFIGALLVVAGAILSAIGHKLFYRNQLRRR